MTSTGFNKIASNCDAMIHIYKFLSFADQLKLAQVDANLQTIFLQYICPKRYNKLKILESGTVHIVSNGTDTDRILIRNPRELEEFLQICGNELYELSTDISRGMEFIKNLVKLICYIDDVTIHDVVRLTKNSPNLEELQFHAYDFEAEPPNCCITRTIVKELLRLTKLKKLVLIAKDNLCNITFKDFCEIVTKLPLETLEINFPILFDSDDNDLAFQQTPLSLMQLKTVNIGNDRRYFSLLNSFRNLKLLSVRLQYRNEMTSALLSLTQLQKLTLSYSNFREEANISLPPNITILHLEHCDGLLLDNLQQFLHENSNPKLMEFVTTGTDFRVREFKELHISSGIKTLNIKGFDLKQFRSPFAFHSAIENLTLYSTEGFDDSAIPFVRLNSISFCHSLHTLDMNGENLEFDILLNLRNLKKLSLHLTLPDQGFYIVRILQELPLLRQLVVRQFVELFDRSFGSLQAVVTCVTSLKIFCLNQTDEMFNFWFDMFSLNPQLNLQMHIPIYGPSTLYCLIHNHKFPRNLRKIQICGFTLDCCQLRKDCYSLLKSMIYIPEDYTDYNRTERKCNIIMCRNKQ
ncbi:uncharacterized protein [Musca autumnalis]|uniref:uncharacterized protein n=1 Tax=Musca autumnalis TaxID=221902 RepID=UPI003CE6EEAA